MITSVIFDFDGVIHDTFNLAYSVFGQLENMSTEEYKDLFNGNVYQHKKILPENLAKYRDLTFEKFKDLTIKKDIKDELIKLKELYNLFIVSSNNEPILNDYIGRNDLNDTFKEVLGMETHQSKHEKFKILINKYDLTRDNTIFITDTLGDILEAHKVGLNTIAVDFGFHDRERLQKGNPLKLVSDFVSLSTEIGLL